MTDLTDLRHRVDSIVWYHTIDLGNGIVTDGYAKTFLAGTQLPDFAGKKVLDIGAWDGYYSFLAERNGASHVTSLDHYAWGVDFAKRNPYWIECAERGVLPDHSRDTTDFWDPSLSGMTGFNLAREVLGSQVEPVVDDFMTMDLAKLGQHDVVMFLGVLYHLKEPFRALERIRQLTREVAVIETEALLIPGRENLPYVEFTAGCFQGFDFSNWYTPTYAALEEWCRAAGFSEVRPVTAPAAPPASPAPPSPPLRRSQLARLESAAARRLGIQRARPIPAPMAPPIHYRAVVHAFP